MKRYFLPLSLLSLSLIVLSSAFGEELSPSEYERRLRHERYKTALARERAEQAFQEDRARHYEYQNHIRETYLQRAEQERHYDQQSNQINTVNQAANTIAGVARQIQVLSGGGW